ncbi:uncharacterized protein TNCV_4117821 [Trichonephila clavipes]|uniref:Uncharacterized protein n=1 Tax=Trichonephila clavipes TaxID=2585209 RepID=A0A8X6RBI6_TRICX|nr:uncharacterized protein TNCV_4117821 [Trichonephila clavipes]
MFTAGKYLRKQMLENGKNVFKDYASESSLKDFVRTRLRRLTSKQIKDNFFQKLQQGKGIRRRYVRNPKHSNAKRRKTNPQKDIFHNGGKFTHLSKERAGFISHLAAAIGDRIVFFCASASDKLAYRQDSDRILYQRKSRT